MRPRLLDLFCGAGGCSVGYARAGFEVVGVDLAAQPNYPFEFHRADALTYPLDGFDAVHASPPCQAYSALRTVHRDVEYPDLVAATRARLIAAGVPYVIENVPGSPLAAVVVLCGSMFGLGAAGRQLRRHRLFETSVLVMQLACQHEGQAIGVYGGGPTAPDSALRGGYQGLMAEKRAAMGIDWPMTRRELNQAIPPAYTEFLGAQLAVHVRAGAAA